MTDDLLPKKKTSSTGKSAPVSGKPKKSKMSPEMLRLIRVNRAIGILFGGFVTLVGIMSLIGTVTDNFWIRLALGLILVIGLPAFVADRFLKRAELGGGLSLVADVFAILLLAIALLLVSFDAASRPLLSREGDRYARSGSATMARVVYFLGGVSPTFPSGTPAPSGSASSTPSASASVKP